MKLPTSLVALIFSLFLAAPLFAQGGGQFVASVSGTRKFQTTKNGKNVIASEAVSAKSLCAAFGVSTKDYAVVFDSGSNSLSLIPLKTMPALPTYQIMISSTFLDSYNSASPSEYLAAYTTGPGADAGGTEFDGFSGLQSYLVKTNLGTTTGATGTFTGVATNANPDYSFFQIKFSAAKAFVQH